MAFLRRRSESALMSPPPPPPAAIAVARGGGGREGDRRGRTAMGVAMRASKLLQLNAACPGACHYTHDGVHGKRAASGPDER